MPVKRIHVLANSVKKQGHCIAGREVIKDGGSIGFGDWIRPVSEDGEGELSWEDCQFPNQKTPKVFDVVSISLKNAPTTCQPENWVIDPDYYWKKITNLVELPDLVIDQPKNLWRDPIGRCDRIATAKLPGLKTGRSLYLIEVDKFRMQFGWNDYQGKQTRRRRALFRYKDRDYDFSLTDPAMDKYCSPFPKPEDGTKTVQLDSGRKCTLCVSLTSPFNGHHYKIVATVIEPQ